MRKRTLGEPIGSPNVFPGRTDIVGGGTILDAGLFGRAGRAVLALIVFALVLGAGDASAQQRKPRIWDIPFGTHVRDLPSHEFVDPACGTNGGPASMPIGSFENFARCSVEEATGLYEVWFIHDDTLEYMGYAIRDAAVADRYRATRVLTQPVILSLLINGDGRLQGYRVVTDPRTEPAARLDAWSVSQHFRARFSGEWDCAELPREEGESPINGRFVKERCQQVSEGRRLTMEVRHYFRPGQHQYNPFGGKPMENAFESSARLDVIGIEPPAPAVQDLLDAAAAAASAPRMGLPAGASSRDVFLAGESIDCPGCDLAGADLRRRNLAGANLSGANLEGAVLHRTVLRDADLLSANFTDANLNRADLTFANLRGATLVRAMLYQADAGRADFGGADLGWAKMGKARLTLANLEGANLDRVDLGEARMNDASLAGATLNNAFLPQAVLLRADLRGVVADGVILSEASLRKANLSGAVITNSDLYLADLADADLSQADFSGSRLVAASLVNTNREGAIFEGAQMPNNAVAQ